MGFLIEKILKVINELRPKIQSDGGDIEFIKFEEDKVYIKLHGACVGCPFSFYTLTLGVEKRLKEEISQIQSIVVVE